VWLGVLGPLLVRANDQVVPIASAKLRVVLGTLIAHNGEPVSLERLAETVWDGSPPKAPHETLRNHVKRLRRVLGQPAALRIRTGSLGYMVELAEGEFDLLRFTALCRAGSAAAGEADWNAASQVLAEALGLWRGTPFCDVPSDVLRREVLPPLEQLWLEAAEGRVEADLHRGRHRELVPELERLVTKYALHERFHGQRMLALYRSGRQAEALGAYEGARRILAEQLGADPGHDLRELHQRMLRADPGLAASAAPTRAAFAGPRPPAPTVSASPPLVPRQLPGVTRHFVGRETELGALTGLVGDLNGTGPIIAAITGTPGSGKTTLAIQFARLVAEHFPDGQLYIDLHGFDPANRPVTAAAAILGFLDVLAEPGAPVPAEVAGQAALYRSALATRRMLIVLDNARDAKQVRPLLPGSPGCLVIVTSRSQLTSLVATDGALQLTLGLFTTDQARELITRYAAAEPAGHEPRATELLVRLCAGLPLALAVATARATTRPGLAFTALAEELRDVRPLDALDAGDLVSNVRDAFSWSYRALNPSAARMFRLLGLHPGPDISIRTAVSLAGVPAHRVRSDLGELRRGHLVTEHAPGRYTVHGLLHAYAVEQACAWESTAERHVAFRRMIDHYLHSGYAAAMHLSPGRRRPVPFGALPGVQPELLTGYAQAMSWFDAEHPTLPTIISQASEAGLRPHARLLAWILGAYFDHRSR
jgi:DNA-binding SARP family transcriptional activator